MKSVVILGIYVTDLAFRAQRMPLLGETVAGSAFQMGPGGKGSNQAVAAARAGADVIFCTRIGADAFGDIAQATWSAEGITSRATVMNDVATGAAHIYVDENTGGNAIIVAAGGSDRGVQPASAARTWAGIPARSARGRLQQSQAWRARSDSTGGRGMQRAGRSAACVGARPASRVRLHCQAVQTSAPVRIARRSDVRARRGTRRHRR